MGFRRGRTWSHNTPTANNWETKLLALPVQTHSHHMTTLLWQKVGRVCVYVCVVGGAGRSSGFPPGSETNGVREIHFPIGTDS